MKQTDEAEAVGKGDPNPYHSSSKIRMGSNRTLHLLIIYNLYFYVVNVY